LAIFTAIDFETANNAQSIALVAHDCVNWEEPYNPKPRTPKPPPWPTMVCRACGEPLIGKVQKYKGLCWNHAPREFDGETDLFSLYDLTDETIFAEAGEVWEDLGYYSPKSFFSRKEHLFNL